jgi:hypothetical protein
VQHGYGDATDTAILKFRNDWIARGSNWADARLKPSDWTLNKQLKDLI